MEKKIFKFRQCIFCISQLSPLGKGCGPSFGQKWICLTQVCFVPSLVEIGPVFLIFFISSMDFSCFVIVFRWKQALVSIWTNFNSFKPMIIWAKFGWNWLSGSEEEDKNVKSLQTDGRLIDCWGFTPYRQYSSHV